MDICEGYNYALGLEGSGGMVRVGPVHYSTVEEIKRFGEALGRISAGVT
jgi:selenocysteine lyase/cysteine desulfurase